jgi:acyl carrier protein
MIIMTIPVNNSDSVINTVRDRVREVVLRVLGDAQNLNNSITIDTPFASLGADSCDQLLILIGLEDAFKITIEDECVQQVLSINDCVSLLSRYKIL